MCINCLNWKQWVFLNVCYFRRWKQWVFLDVCLFRLKLINNANCSIFPISVHPLSEKYENIILFVFFSHIVFYKIIPDR